MKAIKKINNNVAVCTDGNGNELIAFGKGIGFDKMPYEVPLGKIERTFYNISPEYLSLFSEISPEIIRFSAKAVEFIKSKLESELNPNYVITLADHISFCLERHRKGMIVQMPLIYELEQHHPQEVRVATAVYNAMKKAFRVHLPKNEISGLTLNIINATCVPKELTQHISEQEDVFSKFLQFSIKLIEKTFDIKIDRHSFNYTRYATHLKYLVDRIYKNETIDSTDNQLFLSLKEEYSQIYSCIEEINHYCEEHMNYVLSEEEQTYLIIHIHRIITREGL